MKSGELITISDRTHRTLTSDLVDAATTIPEPLLPFNKFLCGLEILDPVAASTSRQKYAHYSECLKGAPAVG